MNNQKHYLSLLGTEKYRPLSLRKKDKKEIQSANYVLPESFKILDKQPTDQLVAIIKELNASVVKLIITYREAQRSYNMLSEKNKKEISIANIGNFVDELLTPSQGENGCSDFEYQVRKEHYKIDNTFCNYIHCRYWFDNEEWGNCVKFTIAKSNEEGGWTLEKIGEIKNALGRGVLSKERIRQMEVEAVKMFIKNLRKEKEMEHLIEYFVKIAKGDEYGIRTEVGPGSNKGKSYIHRSTCQENFGLT